MVAGIGMTRDAASLTSRRSRVLLIDAGDWLDDADGATLDEALRASDGTSGRSGLMVRRSSANSARVEETCDSPHGDAQEQIRQEPAW